METSIAEGMQLFPSSYEEHTDAGAVPEYWHLALYCISQRKHVSDMQLRVIYCGVMKLGTRAAEAAEPR